MNRADDFIEALDDHRRLLAEQVRNIILEYVPGVEEKFSFKIPFYYYYGMFCYINPVKDGGIALGFCRGKDLTLSFPQLEQGDRKMIALVKLYQLKDIAAKEIRELIIAAAGWNKEAKALKIPMVNTGKGKKRDEKPKK